MILETYCESSILNKTSEVILHKTCNLQSSLKVFAFFYIDNLKRWSSFNIPHVDKVAKQHQSNLSIHETIFLEHSCVKKQVLSSLDRPLHGNANCMNDCQYVRDKIILSNTTRIYTWPKIVFKPGIAS